MRWPGIPIEDYTLPDATWNFHAERFGGTSTTVVQVAHAESSCIARLLRLPITFDLGLRALLEMDDTPSKATPHSPFHHRPKVAPKVQSA